MAFKRFILDVDSFCIYCLQGYCFYTDRGRGERARVVLFI